MRIKEGKSVQAEFTPVYDHGLGMQDEQTITIRKLDGDSWDQFPDDPVAMGSNSVVAHRIS